MTVTKRLVAAGFAILVLTVACFGSSVPTSSPDAVGTIVAATMQAIAALNTATPTVASLPGSTSAPTVAPAPAPTTAPNFSTPVPSSATRINFITGATTGVVSASIQPGQVQYYVLNASQGQPMIVMVNSLNNDVTLSVKTQGGTSMLNQSAHQSSWQAMLPQTEDYYIGVYGGASSENYTLSIEIPSRIKFQPDATLFKLNGKTVGGYVVAYTVLAIKDQKMTVTLYSPDNNVALTIYGYTDGQPYVRAANGKTSYTFRLPATQDYIIEVVPMAGKVVNYYMEVTIK
jgi:hypothetical protein